MIATNLEGQSVPDDVLKGRENMVKRLKKCLGAKDMLSTTMAGVARHDGDLSDDEKQIVEKGYKVSGYWLATRRK